MPITQADRIREYVDLNYIEPARQQNAKTVSVTAGNVKRGMARQGATPELPAICSAIGSNKFQEMCQVKRIALDGPATGSTTTFTFEVR